MPLVCCDGCGIEFNKINNPIKEHNFCTDKCRIKWLAELNKKYDKRVKHICQICGKEFLVKACVVENPVQYKHAGRFCSELCQDAGHSLEMTGEKNSFFKAWLKMSDDDKDKFRAKIALAHIGMHFSPEINKKKGHPGNTNPFWHKHHTIESKRIMSNLAIERMKDPEFKQRVVEAAMKANKLKPNKAEILLGDILDRNFPGEWEYTGDGYHVIGGYAPDYTNCNGQKAVIELFGQYWHVEVPHKWSYSELGRIMALNSLGFQCLVIWEHELKDESAVVEKVRQFMKVKTKR
jgi:hypothetical protein